MIRNVLDTKTGPNLTWESVVGATYVLTYEKGVSTQDGDVETYPTTPTTGQQYNNLAKIVPNTRGRAIAKWVLSDDSIALHSLVFVSETDVANELVTRAGISEYSANALVLRMYADVIPVLTSVNCVYADLTEFGAILFDNAFVQYILSTQTEVGSGQQVAGVESDNDKIKFFENKNKISQTFSPIDEFVNALLAIPEIAELNVSSEPQTFAMDGLRNQEATVLDNRFGTLNVATLVEDDLI